MLTKIFRWGLQHLGLRAVRMPENVQARILVETGSMDCRLPLVTLKWRGYRSGGIPRTGNSVGLGPKWTVYLPVKV